MESAYPSVGRTDRGCVRETNEDAFGCAELAWVVADGLGGHPGGEVASWLAAESALQQLSSAGGAGDQALTEAFRSAHEAVRQRGRAERELRSMGTTLVAAVVDDTGQLRVGSVGDSRVYLLGANGLRQLTRDDNVAEELLAAGEIGEAEARTHRGQFMLTKALIADDPQDYPPQLVTVTGPGRLLLCSDGLNAELTDEEIASHLAIADHDEAADALVRAALESGGSDNVTVVLVDLP